MRKFDYAHKLTDEQLADLEQRIAKLYKEAADELTDTVKAYFEQFEKRDAAMKKKLDAGEITEQQYKQWRLAQIGRGKRFEALRDKVAERYTDANATAVAYVNDATPGIYTLNRNYAAYKIEQVSDSADFALWDEQTVRRLIVEQPDLMPYYPPKRALQRGIDLKYGKQQITASVTSSILQGKGIGKIADDLQSRMQDMNRTSAIRTARTAVTGAQNAGRLDTYRAALDMGIKLKKRWLATLDKRTRHAHAMLDGQIVDVDKPFKVDGYELMYPGDSSAPGYLVYNCRCTQIAEVDGEDTSSGGRRAIDPETGESVLVKDMTYAEWAGWKEKTSPTPRAAFSSFANIQNVATVKTLKTIKERYEAAPDAVKKIWDKCSSQFKAPVIDGTPLGGAYNPSDRPVHFDKIETAFGSNSYKKACTTFFHEYGHNIDHILGENGFYSTEYKDRILGKTINRECEETYTDFWLKVNNKTVYEIIKDKQNGAGGMGISGYMKEAIKGSVPKDEYRKLRRIINDSADSDEILRPLFDKYCSQSAKHDILDVISKDKETAKKFCDTVVRNYNDVERYSVSDMYERFMLDKFGIGQPFGSGHGTYYNNNKDYGVCVETFAEMVEASCGNDDSLKTIKKFFPESYDVFLEMLREAMQ